jgi:hypothetical protein
MTPISDDKGKIFTDVIHKIALPVVIMTQSHKIHGEVYVRPNERLKDELNSSDGFIAVTNATVFDHQGVELYTANFLTLNLKLIVWLIPDDEITHK